MSSIAPISGPQAIPNHDLYENDRESNPDQDRIDAEMQRKFADQADFSEHLINQHPDTMRQDHASAPRS